MLLQLPDDLVAHLTTFLSNKDRKILRLTNKQLNGSFPLRMSRVFLSPSHKNIEVFRAVAAHPLLRKQVKEIIWDDARFEQYVLDDGLNDAGMDSLWFERAIKNQEDFEDARNENLDWVGGIKVETSEADFVRARRSGFAQNGELLNTDDVSPNEYLSFDESFELYTRLYDEQETIIRDRLDIEAFKEGLAAFTELERVIVTSEAYRPHIMSPFYQTPFIKSLPLGFNYPAPWPWMPDERNEALSELNMDDIRTHWHGVVAVLEALAHFDERPVPELVIDTRYEHAGIAWQFFESPSPELQNLETVCQRLRRLDLAINTFCTFGNPGLQQLPHSQLSAVLAKATSMESFSLHTASGEDYPIENDMRNVLSVVPLESWPLLRHITLSSIPVTFANLVQFFKRLPERLKSVQLVNVDLPRKGSTYKALLETCRDELCWTSGRSRLIVGMEEGGSLSNTWKIWIEDEIADFLAGRGPNPFVGMVSENYIQFGFGTIRDDLDPNFSKPHILDPTYNVYVSPGVYRHKTKAEWAEEERQQQQQLGQ